MLKIPLAAQFGLGAHCWGHHESDMNSATKADLEDTLLGFNPSCNFRLQGALNRVCNFPELEFSYL